MRLLITILLLFNVAYGQTKEIVKLGSWNTYVYNPGIPAPIIIAYGGMGEAGTDINKLLGNGFPQLMHSQNFIPLKQVYIVCPQAEYGMFPTNRFPELLALIKAKYPLADTSRKYITGLSIGGQAVMEQLIYKPLLALPMSAAGGGNTLVNFIAQNKIPIIHWTGSLEPDNIGWTLYQVNQKVPGLTKTITRIGKGHCCWNDVLKSAEFWDLIKTDKPKKDTTVNSLNPFTLPSGAWVIKSSTAKAGTYSIQSGKLVTMSEGVFVLDGDFEYTITFKKPPAVAPKEYATIIINGRTTVLYSHPDKNFYKGQPYSMEFICAGGQTLILKNDYTWQLK